MAYTNYRGFLSVTVPSWWAGAAFHCKSVEGAAPSGPCWSLSGKIKRWPHTQGCKGFCSGVAYVTQITFHWPEQVTWPSLISTCRRCRILPQGRAANIWTILQSTIVQSQLNEELTKGSGSLSQSGQTQEVLKGSHSHQGSFFFNFFYFWATPQGLQDLSFQTRN